METVEILYRKFQNIMNDKLDDLYFDIVYEKLENSIDFMMDGEPREIECLRCAFDLRTRADLCLSVTEDAVLVSLRLKINIDDFTSISKFEHVILKDAQPIHNFEENIDSVVEFFINKLLLARRGVLRLVKPSTSLSRICGGNLQKRYEILDTISKHILKNGLVMPCGSIRVDSLLEDVVGKGTYSVNEYYFFDALRSHCEVVG